jgi:hypothetical protein
MCPTRFFVNTCQVLPYFDNGKTDLDNLFGDRERLRQVGLAMPANYAIDSVATQVPNANSANALALNSGDVSSAKGPRVTMRLKQPAPRLMPQTGPDSVVFLLAFLG